MIVVAVYVLLDLLDPVDVFFQSGGFDCALFTVVFNHFMCGEEGDLVR